MTGKAALRAIVDAVMNGEEVDSEDLALALVMMDRLLNESVVHLTSLCGLKRVDRRAAEFVASEYFGTIRAAAQTPPSVWLGEAGNPKNPEMQERRALAKARTANLLH